MNTATQRKINEGLALAMGWHWLSHNTHFQVLAPPHLTSFPRGETVLYIPYPAYFTDSPEAHKWKAGLLSWLHHGADEVCGIVFQAVVRHLLDGRIQGRSLDAIAADLLLATPAQVATAAAIVLGIITESEVE